MFKVIFRYINLYSYILILKNEENFPYSFINTNSVFNSIL